MNSAGSTVGKYFYFDSAGAREDYIS
ncbi:hypothetical protein bas02_0083 [Veterinaerplatzvirus Jeanpiccard]|uniref:Uncharacterized protein n=1 Tax=Escherichia phage JeanPiccard TaxID=2851955 RepID=A0AAE8B1V2_9CAUD|nr:hypothetical protein bas02_0083 [Escherichia phage JeanPiccard]